MTLLTALDTGRSHVLARKLALAFAASLLLTLSAKISVPFFPVPMTMQTFVVVGIGLAMGPVWGVAAVAMYLMQGALGLPVFAGTPAKGIGLAYMAGPTGGYLAGYLVAAFLTGKLAERGWDRNVVTAFLSALAGAVALYVPGLLWLGQVVGWDKPVLDWGLWPFVYGDLLKTALAAAVFPAAWAILKKKGIA